MGMLPDPVVPGNMWASFKDQQMSVGGITLIRIRVAVWVNPVFSVISDEAWRSFLVSAQSAVSHLATLFARPTVIAVVHNSHYVKQDDVQDYMSMFHRGICSHKRIQRYR